MCKTKAEGGRCNGWYAREISRLTELASNVANDEYNEANVKKLNALKNKIEQRKQDIKDKPLVEIPENMTLNDLKREHKKLKKTAEIYRKYDPIKYKQLQRKVGEQVRKNIFESVVSVETQKKLNKYNLEPEDVTSITIALNNPDKYGIAKHHYYTLLESIKTKHPYNKELQKLNNSDVKNMFSEEEFSQLHEAVFRGKMYDTFTNNTDKLARFLNEDLKIETGNPDKNLLSKADTSYGVYRSLDATIPTKFFTNRNSSKLDKTEPKTYSWSSYDLIREQYNYDLNLSKTDDEIKKQLETHISNNNQYKMSSWRHYDVKQIHRTSQNDVYKIDTTLNEYKFSKDVPQAKDFMTPYEYEDYEWVEVPENEIPKVAVEGVKIKDGEKLYKGTPKTYVKNHFEKDFYGDLDDSFGTRVENALSGYSRLCSDVDDFSSTSKSMASLLCGRESDDYRDVNELLGEMVLR